MGDFGRPKMDRTGMNQPEFGMQDGSMSFPRGYETLQPQPTDPSQPRHTTGWRCRLQLEIEKHLEIGTPLFVQKDVNVSAHTIWSLPLLRYQLRMARELQARLKGGAMKTVAISTTFPSSKRIRVNEPQAETFLASMESLFENVEFAGISNGSPSPYAANGPYQNSFSVLTAKSQVIPTVTMGHSFFPNFFYSPIQNGQELFMIIKPVEVRFASKFVSPYGDPTASSLSDSDLVIDIIFFTNPENKPPRRISGVEMLEYITKGTQPPLDSRSYIEMNSDGDYELKDGLVYSIGKSLHHYPMRPSYMPSEGDGLPNAMQTNGVTAMIEIALGIRRLY